MKSSQSEGKMKGRGGAGVMAEATSPGHLSTPVCVLRVRPVVFCTASDAVFLLPIVLYSWDSWRHSDFPHTWIKSGKGRSERPPYLEHF